MTWAPLACGSIPQLVAVGLRLVTSSHLRDYGFPLRVETITINTTPPNSSITIRNQNPSYNLQVH